MNITTNRRKVLVPLATMAVAGAVVVGSGATFTSESVHSASVAAGALSHSNTHNGQTLAVTNIKPGDTKTGTLTITNTGTLDATATLEETADASAFTAGDLKLKITQGATVLYDGNFGALVNGSKLDLGSLPVGASTTVTYTVSMPSTAGNENQGKTASASYKYVTTQASNDQSGIGWN